VEGLTGLDWTELAQDRVRWDLLWTFGSIKTGNFPPNWRTVKIWWTLRLISCHLKVTESFIWLFIQGTEPG